MGVGSRGVTPSSGELDQLEDYKTPTLKKTPLDMCLLRVKLGRSETPNTLLARLFVEGNVFLIMLA